MSDNLIPHTPGPYTDYFQISYKIAETFGANLYSGINVDSSKPTVLWVSKFPVNLTSAEAQNLLLQMHSIDVIDPPVGPFDTYGIDFHGLAFLSFTEKISNNLNQSRANTEEMERRLFKAIRLVHKAHQANCCFGDLNPNSFWLNNSGGVELTSVLKLPMTFQKSDLASFDSQLIAYLAPEVFEKVVSTQSDVYSLGMIAFYLILNRLPVEVELTPEGLPKIDYTLENTFKKQLPPYLLEVLEKAISLDPALRYQTAGELIEALVAINERIKVGDKRETPATEPIVNILPAIRSKDQMQIEKFQESLAKRLANNAYKIIFSVIAFVILASLVTGLMFYRHYRQTLAREINEATAPFSGGNPELTKSIAQISNISAELKDKIAEIQSLAESPDPLSYGLLVASADNSKDDLLVKNSQSAIIQKLQSSGQVLTAIQLEQWFRYGNKDIKSPVFGKVLKLLDPAMPLKNKLSAINKLNSQDLNISTRLAAALYFDLKQPDSFKELLVQQIGKGLGIPAAEKLSALALIMQHEALHQIFSEQIKSNYSKLSEYDLKVLLEYFAKRDQQVFKDLVKIIIEQNIYPKLKARFLVAIISNKDLSIDLTEALTMVAVDKVDASYLNRIVTWQSPQAEELLFSLISILEDNEGKVMVLDSLAIRNLQSNPGQGFVKWLKENKWEQRQKYLDSLATLATSVNFTEQEILSALKIFQKDLQDTGLQNALLASADDRLPLLFIENFSESIGLAQKLNLLKHPNTEIRKAIIKRLETNDVGAMKLIVDAYSLEQNEELKNIYKEKYWFVKNR